MIFHTVHHHQSFISIDCMKTHPPTVFLDFKIAWKFSSVQTRCAVIIKESHPYTIAEIVKETNTSSFYDISTGESNYNAEKFSSQ